MCPRPLPPVQEAVEGVKLSLGLGHSRPAATAARPADACLSCSCSPQLSHLLEKQRFFFFN